MFSNPFAGSKQRGGGSQQSGGGSQKGRRMDQNIQIIDPRPSLPLHKQISELKTFGGQLVARTALTTITIQNQVMRNMLHRFCSIIEEQTEYILRIFDPDAGVHWEIHFFYTIRVPQMIPPQIIRKAQQLRKHYRMVAAQDLPSDIDWSIQRDSMVFPCVSITSGQDEQTSMTNLEKTPMIDIPFFRSLLDRPYRPFVFHLPRPKDKSPSNLMIHVSNEIVSMKKRCHNFAIHLKRLLSDRISDRTTLMSTLQDMLKKT